MKKLAVAVFVFVVAAAFGATAHRITLDKPAVVNGTELKAGDYKLELDGEKVTISNKKSTVEATVRVETTGDKIRSTTVCCLSEGGKYNLQEIRLGGTNQKLVLGNDSASK
jgi:hypothetical protein